MINWRSIKYEQPDKETECLTQMKHGLISGYYDKSEGAWNGYFFQDICWYATYWVPVSELGEDLRYD